jgi:hypothetical protein
MSRGGEIVTDAAHVAPNGVFALCERIRIPGRIEFKCLNLEISYHARYRLYAEMESGLNANFGAMIAF